MKQKSPRRESSYKNFDLGGMLRVQTLSESWAKCSFVELLVTIFSRKKNLIESFYFQIFYSPCNSRSSRRNNEFIRNIPALFVLFILIPIYRSNNGGVTERKFYLTKIQRQTHRGSDYRDVYTKYSPDLNGRFQTFWYRFQPFGDGKNGSENYSSNSLVFCTKSLLGYDSIPKWEFSENFYDPRSYMQELINRDPLWLRKIILGNLRNWRESDEVLARSLLSLKKKEDLDLSKRTELNSQRFLMNHSRYLWKLHQQRQIIAGKRCEYLLDESRSSKSFMKLESILSTSIYKISRYLSQEKRNNDQIVNRTYSEGNFGNRSYVNNLIHTCVDAKMEVDGRDESSNSANPNSEWIKKIMYMENKSIMNPIPIQITSSMDDLTPWQERVRITNLGRGFCHTFPEPFQKNIYHSDNYIGTDDIGINSFTRIQRYYSRLLWNYSLPMNSIYNIIRPKYLMNQKIYIFWRGWKRLLPKRIHPLLLIRFISKDSNTFVNRIELKQNLTKRNNQSNLSMDRSEKTKDPNPLLLLLSPDRGVDNKPICNRWNELINNSLSIPIYTNSLNIYDSIQNNCKRYSSQLLNNYFGKKFFSKSIRNHEQGKIIYEYSMIREAIITKSFIWSIRRYKKWISGVYEWIARIRDWIIFDSSKRFVSSNLSIEFESLESFKTFIRHNDLESIDIISNFSQIYTKTLDFRPGYNRPFNRSDKYIDREVLMNLYFGHRNSKDWIIEPLIAEMSNESNLLTRLPRPKISYLDSAKNHGLVTTSDFRSDFDKRFLFRSGELNFWDYDIIYSHSLKNKNLLKSDEFASIIARKKYSTLGKNYYMLAKSYLSPITSSETLYKDLDESKVNSSYKICDHPFIKYFRAKIYLKNFVEIGPVSKPDRKMMKKPYHDMLRYVSLVRDRNGKTSQLITKLPSYFEYEYSEYGIGDRTPEDESISSGSSRSLNSYLFARSIPFWEYTSWFFTPEWWRYHSYLFLEISQEVYSAINSYFESLGCYHTQIVGKNLYELNSGWDSYISLDDREGIVPDYSWLYSRLINSWNGLWTVLTLVSFILLSQQNPLSILIGSDPLCLWEHFETIGYLTDTSRVFYSTRSMHPNRARSNKIENSVMSLLESLKHHVRNIQFHLLMKKQLNEWLMSHKGLDLSRREKSLLVQSLITRTRMKEYGFNLYPKRELLSNESGYQVTNQQGFSYLRYLSKLLKKNLVHYPLESTKKWIHLASLEKIIFSQTLCLERNLNIRVQQIPIPLRFGLSRAKGILLIGPIETGRSYSVKNSAADSCVPLLGIYMDRFLYNKPDIITESWMNILVESLRRLNLILDLTRGISPCMIWIRNIHQLDVNRPTRNIESEPTFLLGILLRYFQTNSIKTRIEKNIIVIGSTHLPGKVDPALISAERLDRIINIRSSNNSRRRNQFFILLNRNNLRLRNELLYLDIDSRTTGYNTRDLAALTNEISLISITGNKSFICANTIELAFRRQIFRFTHTNNQSHFQQNFEVLFYKIGRAIIQNIMIKSSAMNPLNISNYLWKKNFYYLSEWYLEQSVDHSITKEFTILTCILSCLAGIAARDSWFLRKKNSDILIPLDKLVENDLSLVSSILESLPAEFPWLEIRETRVVNYEQRETKTFPIRNSSSIIQNGLFAMSGRNTIHIRNDSEYNSLISQQKFIGGKNFEFQSIAWSPRYWRLNFFRSHLFDWIKRPNDSEFSHGFESSKGEKYTIRNDSEEKNHPSNQLMETRKEQLIYERILPRVKRRNVQELEFRSEQILLKEQSELSGFFQSSTQYRMEHRVSTRPRLFIGKRILWDPTSSFTRIRNFIFSRREFFIDEEMLRRLYVTYGIRRERERSLFNHRIKRFLLRRGYNKELIDKLSVRWWNQLSMGERQSIDTWKRIEEIGVRLRRPQVFTPVYLYQRWLIENLPEKFPRFELLTQRQRWLKSTNLLLTDSFTHTTLLESYQYLLRFFSFENILLDRATKMLLMKKWLLQDEFRCLIHNQKHKK